MTDSQSLAPAALDSAVGGLTLGEPVSWHGLTVFPLLGSATAGPAYDSLGAALAACTFGAAASVTRTAPGTE